MRACVSVVPLPLKITPTQILAKDHKLEKHYWACMASTQSCIHRRNSVDIRQYAHAGVSCRKSARHRQPRVGRTRVERQGDAGDTRRLSRPEIASVIDKAV